MSERMQLKEAGAEHVMLVKRATTETIENTEYVKFDDGKVDLLVPASSVERQFERLGVTRIAEMEGMAVKFSRSTKLSKYGKPFWNLDVATGADRKALSVAPTPSKRLTEPSARAATSQDPHAPLAGDEAPAPTNELRDKRMVERSVMLNDYLALYDIVAGHLCATGKRLEFPVDATGINSATASIFIGWQKRGLDVLPAAVVAPTESLHPALAEETDDDLPF